MKILFYKDNYNRVTISDTLYYKTLILESGFGNEPSECSNKLEY